MTRKVDRLSCVRYGSARYSVPTTAIGAQVEVRVHGDQLTVLTGDNRAASSTVLACHRLVGPGEVSIVDDHYGSTRPATPARAIRPKTVRGRGHVSL